MTLNQFFWPNYGRYPVPVSVTTGTLKQNVVVTHEMVGKNHMNIRISFYETFVYSQEDDYEDYDGCY